MSQRNHFQGNAYIMGRWQSTRARWTVRLITNTSLDSIVDELGGLS